MFQFRPGAFAIFFFSLGIALSFATHTWDGVVFVSNSQLSESHRTPAALHKTFDYSTLEGGALKMLSPNRLLEEAQVFNEAGNVALEFGHFVTKGDGDQKLFACDYYDHIHLVFKANGAAINGEASTMSVEAPCKVSEDLNHIAAIYIPIEKIKNEKAHDMDLSYNQTGMNFRFENMSDTWPESWTLTGVRLRRESEVSKDIIYSEKQIKESVKGQITVKF